MSQKYKLVQDVEDDSPNASIQRHLNVALWLVVVPVLALLLLSLVYSLSAARTRAARETELREAIQTQQAMPPRPTSTPLPPPSVSRDTALRTGPAIRFDAIRTLKAGERVTIVGTDTTGKWFLLDNGGWIAAITVRGDKGNPPLVSP